MAESYFAHCDQFPSPNTDVQQQSIFQNSILTYGNCRLCWQLLCMVFAYFTFSFSDAFRINTNFEIPEQFGEVCLLRVFY